MNNNAFLSFLIFMAPLLWNTSLHSLKFLFLLYHVLQWTFINFAFPKLVIPSLYNCPLPWLPGHVIWINLTLPSSFRAGHTSYTIASDTHIASRLHSDWFRCTSVNGASLVKVNGHQLWGFAWISGRKTQTNYDWVCYILKISRYPSVAILVLRKFHFWELSQHRSKQDQETE